jgi:hypothetical protein
VVAAEAEVARAEADDKRVRELYESNQIVSRRDLDQVIRDARVTQAQLEATRKKALAAEA